MTAIIRHFNRSGVSLFHCSKVATPHRTHQRLAVLTLISMLSGSLALRRMDSPPCDRKPQTTCADGHELRLRQV